MEFLHVGSGKIRQVFGWAKGKDKRAGSLVYFSFDDIPLLLAGWACNQWSFSSIFGLFLRHFFFVSCVYYGSYPFVLSYTLAFFLYILYL